MPRNRERDIKERIRVRVRDTKNREEEFFTHTTSFLIWWFCGLTWSSECKRPLEAPSVCFAGHVCRSKRRFWGWLCRKRSRVDGTECATERFLHVRVAGRITYFKEYYITVDSVHLPREINTRHSCALKPLLHQKASFTLLLSNQLSHKVFSFN